MIKEEFHAPDGQVFMTLMSVQIAHAFMTFINKFPIKFYAYDPVAAINRDQCVSVPTEAVAGKHTMAGIRSNFRRGCMRQSADIMCYPDPEKKDPQWEADQIKSRVR